MKFDTPASTNPIDQLKVIGRPTDRIDGKFKTTGTGMIGFEPETGLFTSVWVDSRPPAFPRGNARALAPA